ncbi:peptidase, partial [Bifidobacteriaceae bacterium WP012]
MANSNSRKHARKVMLDAAVSNAIEKAVDARKVAAFTVGAAGVLAGAAFAFGATPAMAAEAGAAADTNTAPVTAGEKAGKKADADEKGKDVETGKSQTDANKEAGEQSDKKAESDKKEDANKLEENKQTEEKSGAKQGDQSVVKTDDKKSDEEKQKQETTTAADTTTDGQDREASTTPEPKPQSNSTIELSQDKKDTLPNMYAWGKSDNVYVESGQNTSVTFKFAAPADGYKISNIAIFPTDTNGVENTKSRKYLEYYSAPGAENEHKPYSGTYDFKVKDDGSATLTMTKLYRDGSLKSGESYSANRC